MGFGTLEIEPLDPQSPNFCFLFFFYKIKPVQGMALHPYTYILCALAVVNICLQMYDVHGIFDHCIAFDFHKKIWMFPARKVDRDICCISYVQLFLESLGHACF